MIIFANKPCEHDGFFRQQPCSVVGNGYREFCAGNGKRKFYAQHARVGMVNAANKMCEYDSCSRTASYGVGNGCCMPSMARRVWSSSQTGSAGMMAARSSRRAGWR